MMTLPPLFPAIPGRARADDARVSAPAIAARLRPGPGDSLAPLPAGPRPPVPPTPPLASRTIHPGQGSRVALQTATLHRRAIGPQAYTLADARAVRKVRAAVVGKAGPMSYTAGYVIPLTANAGARGA